MTQSIHCRFCVMCCKSIGLKKLSVDILKKLLSFIAILLIKKSQFKNTKLIAVKYNLKLRDFLKIAKVKIRSI